ncbi:MAG: AAA family ATPase [Eubacterium sp.]|nr:AAA family ATPase [Eubacterium sp.]
MRRHIHLAVVDTVRQFLPYAEEEIIRRYADRMTVHLITDASSAAGFFDTPSTIDVLLINESAYGIISSKAKIGKILLQKAEVAVDEEEYPENVEVVLKYVSSAETFLRIEEILRMGGVLPPGENEPEQHNTRVIAVFSPIGGCGKSLVSYALAKKLRKLDQKVLLVGCDATQSVGVFFPDGIFAREELIDQLSRPGEETYWTILQNVGQYDAISYLLPFEKTLSTLEMDPQKWELFLTVLTQKHDFDFIILDVGNVLNRATASLMGKSDYLILLTETNLIANRKMQKLLRDSDLLPNCECILLANEYRADGMRIAAESVFGTISPYPDWEEALEDPVFYQIALKVTE